MSISEATDKNSATYAGPEASSIGKKTYAISRAAYGKLEQTGDLISGYPIFSTAYDNSDRLRFLFGKTWTSTTIEGDKEELTYLNPGDSISVDRFFIDWYNSFSEAQMFPFGTPDDAANNSESMITFLAGIGSTSQHEKEVDNTYTFEHTKQYREQAMIRIDLNGLGEPFESNLLKGEFESLFTDDNAGYSYYNAATNQITSGATRKSIVNFDKWFFDYSFTYDQALTDVEINSLNSLPGVLYANIDTHYSPNFNFDKYRQTISSVDISETGLPMYYAFPEVAGYLDDQEYSPAGLYSTLPGFEDVYGSIFKDSIALNVNTSEAAEQVSEYTTLSNLYGENTIHGTNGIDYKLAGSSDKELYYKLYSIRMNQFLGAAGQTGIPPAGPVHEKISNKYTNICLTDSKKDLIKNYDFVRSQYPMSVGINFLMDRKKYLSDIFNETSMMAPLMGYVTKTHASAVETPFVELNEQITTDTTPLGTSLNKGYTKNEGAAYKSWDIINIIHEYINNFSNFFDWDAQKKIAFVSDNQIDFLNPSQSLIKLLFSSTMLNYISQYSENSHRKYTEILSGDKNEESEVLFYRIEKSDSVGNLIQNIYIPNMAGLDSANILDTQVKYDKYYNYKIYAYHAVAGTMYKYAGPVDFMYSWPVPPPPPDPGTPAQEVEGECDENNPIPFEGCETAEPPDEASGEEFPIPELIDPEDQWMLASFFVLSQPTIRLIEVPYFNVQNTKPTIILDKPPVPPDINIVPFNGIHNKILILFNASVGNYNLNPITLLMDDEARFVKIRESQGLSPGDPVNFQTDDINVSYQIFRASKPPLSYGDFSFVRPTNINITSHVDTISPNRKYYYTFRAVDKNGHISNPTAIYEVELVTLEDGSDVSKSAILPLIKEYNFPEDADSYATRDFRKYLLIKPAIGQDEINIGASNFPGSATNMTGGPSSIKPSFGVREKKVFSQTTGELDPSTGTWTEASGSVPKFKLRVTSKATGRKIDINFKFTNKRKEQFYK